MLKPYRIAPKQFKENGEKARGYLRAHFEDAWARYLPKVANRYPGTFSRKPASRAGFWGTG